MNGRITEEEQMCMLAVTMCKIGDIHTEFNIDRGDDGAMNKVYTNLFFTIPEQQLPLNSRQFLRHAKVQHRLKIGLITASSERYVKAHDLVIGYIKDQGWWRG